MINNIKFNNQTNNFPPPELGKDDYSIPKLWSEQLNKQDSPFRDLKGVIDDCLSIDELDPLDKQSLRNFLNNLKENDPHAPFLILIRCQNILIDHVLKQTMKNEVKPDDPYNIGLYIDHLICDIFILEDRVHLKELVELISADKTARKFIIQTALSSLLFSALMMYLEFYIERKLSTKKMWRDKLIETAWLLLFHENEPNHPEDLPPINEQWRREKNGCNPDALTPRRVLEIINWLEFFEISCHSDDGSIPNQLVENHPLGSFKNRISILKDRFEKIKDGTSFSNEEPIFDKDKCYTRMTNWLSSLLTIPVTIEWNTYLNYFTVLGKTLRRDMNFRKKPYVVSFVDRLDNLANMEIPADCKLAAELEKVKSLATKALDLYNKIIDAADHTISRVVLDDIDTATEEMKAIIKINGNTLDRIPWEKVESWRSQKKKIKVLHATNSISKKSDLQIQFCATYDKFVESDRLLSVVRKVSQEIREFMRKGATLSDRSIYIISHFGSIKWAETTRITQTKVAPPFFDDLRKTICKAYIAYLNSQELWNDPRVFLHGTRSNAIESMMTMPKPAVRSAQKLLENEITVHSGEAMSDSKHAGGFAAQISGQHPSRFLVGHDRYQETRLGHCSRVECVKAYASRKNMEEIELTSSAEKMEKRLTLESLRKRILVLEYSGTLDRDDDFWRTRNLELVRFDLMRLESYGRLTTVKLETIKTDLQKLEVELGASVITTKIDSLFKKNYNWIERAIKRIATAEPSKPVTQPKRFDESFPVILGIPNQRSAPSIYYQKGEESTESSECKIDDKSNEGHLLGTSVRVAFTPSEHIRTLNEWFGPLRQRVEVQSMEVASFVELWHGLRAEKIPKDFNLTYSSKKEALNKLSFLFQNLAMPYYTALFPPKPWFLHGNEYRVTIEKPRYNNKLDNYADYKEKVLSGKQVAREIHGPMHAARTTLWILLLVELFDQTNVTHNRNLLMHGLAAMYHDSGRQDDGVDRWDVDSAHRMYNDLERFLNAPPFIEMDRQSKSSSSLHNADISKRLDLFIEIANAVAQKDAKKELTGQYDLQMALHDADCLDIMRIYRGKDFERKRLYIYQIFASNPRSANTIDKVIEEIESFIVFTEDPKVKLEFEQNTSEEHLKSIFYLMFLRNNDESRLFPLLSHIMLNYR